MTSKSHARRIKLVGLDVDGTLTDGGIYLGATDTPAGSQPFELKRYDIQDGLGIHLMRSAGIKVALVTGRSSESVRMRAAELSLDGLEQDAGARKLPMWRSLLARHNISEADAAFVGDDIPDLGIMKSVGLAVAVGNCVPEIAAIADVQLKRAGGHGAIREFSEWLLRARGEWDECVRAYVEERDGIRIKVPK